MKICIINNVYAPYFRGGAVTVAAALAKRMREAGHEVSVIAARSYFRKPVAPAGESVRYLPSLYFHLEKIPKPLRLFWHALSMFDLLTAARIKWIFDEEKPELVITNNLVGLSFLIPGIIKKAGARHRHILHDIQLLHPSGLMFYGKEKIIDSCLARLYQRINRFLFRHADEIYSPSAWLLDLHLDKGFFQQAQRAVKLNPISLPPLSERTQTGGPFIFLYVGQLEKSKGIALLLSAYAKFRQKEPACSALLRIAGDGAERGIVEKAALTGEVEYLGYLSEDELREQRQSAHCLVVPSLCYENSPAVIYEALAAGLPVLASRLGGIPELVHRFGGLLFTPGDENELIKKMRWAYSHRSALVEIGEKGRVKFRKIARN